jgi:transposase
MTVRRYLAKGGFVAYRRPARWRTLAGLEDWLAERFRRHAGNADVVRQELMAEKGIALSLRTVEREVAPLRRALEAEARATVRFETPPGQQLQIDFGERRVAIAGVSTKVFLFVATLGYSRQLLLDNDRGLVSRHDVETREVEFNVKFRAFARHWGTRPRACAPYRARTKGKDERGVGYVKRNAIAGRPFASFAAMEAHLDQWAREVADLRVHGTTGEAPIERFRRDEARALRSIAGIPSFQAQREVTRKVQADCAIEVDGNSYSVPWHLIGESVRVVIAGEALRVHHAGREVAVHVRRAGRRQRVVDPAHFEGVAGFRARAAKPAASAADPPETEPPSAPALLRPLAEYEALIGGGF